MDSHRATDIPGQRGIVVSVAFAAFMAKLDSSILNISLPEIADYFQATTSEASRVVLIYMIVMTGTLLLFGQLSDRWGVKRLFMAGYAIFTLGSLMCGLSWSLDLLIAARLVQGLGGSMLFISGFTIIPRCLPAGRTGWAFGLLGSAGALALALGGPAGGLIAGLLSWHWIFLINVPMGLVAMTAAHRFLLPDAPRKPSPKTPFDIAGAVLSCVGLALFMHAASFGHEKGWTSGEILLSFAAAGLAMAGFLLRERRAAAPILDFAILRRYDFTLANGSAFLAVMVLAGSLFLIPFYLHDFLGLQPETAGFVTLAYSLVYMLAGPMAGRLSDRTHPRSLTSLGMGVGAAASLGFVLTLGQPGLAWVIAFYMFLAVAFACFIAPSNNMVMGLAPRDKVGASAGLFQTVNNLGQAMGIVCFETAYSWDTPAVTCQAAPDAPVSPADHALLALGFQRAFLVGAVICLGSLMLARLIRGNARRDDPSPSDARPGGGLAVP